METCFNSSAQEEKNSVCLLYTSDAADERSSVDLGGRRIIKKKTTSDLDGVTDHLCINIHIDDTVPLHAKIKTRKH